MIVQWVLAALRHHRCSICEQWRPIWMPGDHTKCMEGWLWMQERKEQRRSEWTS